MTRGTGALYPAEFILDQMMSSARGLYPEFRQWDFNPKGITALQNLFKDRGYFLESSVEVGGERGAIVLKSGVTRSPRVVATIPGIGSRVVATITFDFNSKNTRPDARFVRNLLSFPPKHDASESLLPMTNGLIEYVLANGKGELQRVVPPDIAADGEKPAGEKELELGKSCVICHRKNSGHQKIHNDLHLLIGSGADYFGEEIAISGRKFSKEQAVDIVTGRYGGDIDEADGDLGRARRDYIRAVQALTNYPAVADGPDAAQSVAVKFQSITYRYLYGDIDARVACMELGVRVPETQNARRVFSLLLPPPGPGVVEDVMFGLLRGGAVIGRDDWNAVYPEAARRIGDRRKELLK